MISPTDSSATSNTAAADFGQFVLRIVDAWSTTVTQVVERYVPGWYVELVEREAAIYVIDDPPLRRDPPFWFGIVPPPVGASSRVVTSTRATARPPLAHDRRNRHARASRRVA